MQSEISLSLPLTLTLTHCYMDQSFCIYLPIEPHRTGVLLSQATIRAVAPLSALHFTLHLAFARLFSLCRRCCPRWASKAWSSLPRLNLSTSWRNLSRVGRPWRAHESSCRSLEASDSRRFLRSPDAGNLLSDSSIMFGDLSCSNSLHFISFSCAIWRPDEPKTNVQIYHIVAISRSSISSFNWNYWNCSVSVFISEIQQSVWWRAKDAEREVRSSVLFCLYWQLHLLQALNVTATSQSTPLIGACTQGLDLASVIEALLWTHTRSNRDSICWRRRHFNAPSTDQKPTSAGSSDDTSGCLQLFLPSSRHLHCGSSLRPSGTSRARLMQPAVLSLSEVRQTRPMGMRNICARSGARLSQIWDRFEGRSRNEAVDILKLGFWTCKQHTKALFVFPLRELHKSLQILNAILNLNPNPKWNLSSSWIFSESH